MTKKKNTYDSCLNVVVIDDDVMVLRSVESALTDFGFSVTAFEDPLKGIDWIAKNGADIVVSDIRMPQCDGFEVLKRVKEIDPQCDLIFITAHGQMKIAIRALREGATDFFEKPFTPAALHVAIERTQRFRILAQQKELLTDKVNLLTNELLYGRNNRNVMLGQSAGMKNVAEQIVDLADSTATVLILGESGTGKELVANAIHVSGSRKDKPFLSLNCPSIPEDLFESEMFGHRRGAFTGAIETRNGYLGAAAGGTLFLDEIGDMPLKSQAKMLRLLEEKTYFPVGEHREKTTDVRIIAATNQSLQDLVKEKRFRKDLYYRLSVCTVELPSLRERKDDLPLLALYFTLRFSSEMGKSIDGIDDKSLQILSAYDYPGNIRELRNIIESSMIHCRHSGPLNMGDLPKLITEPMSEGEDGAWPMTTIKFEDVEVRLYEEALRRVDNNVSAAARLLGLSRGKLRRRLEALGIQTNGYS